MADKDLTFNILTNHFEKVGWPQDVNRQKFYDRAKVVSHEDFENSAIVEIERHRAMLGTAYIKGVRMDAFETYFMRYAVDLSNRSVSELTERRGAYQFDTYGIVEDHLSFEFFSLSIEAEGDNCYLIRESVSNDESIVSSREEAVDYVLALGDPFDDYFSERVSELDNLEDQAKEELLSSYKLALKEALLSRAEELWKARDEDT